MHEPKIDLPFTLEEYTGRLEEVRAQLDARDLDALMVYWPENIYYLTGYDSLGYFSYQVLIIPKTAEPFAVVRRLERQNVINATWLDECYVYQDGESPVEATIKALKGRGLANKKLGIELDGYFLSVRNYLKLADALNLADTSQLVNRIRLVKSAKEIEYIRAAARAMETGAHAAIKAIRVGATENDVAAALLEASIRAGSEYTGHASLVATGPRSSRPFATWSGRKIEKGDILAFEPGACVHRYHGLMVRSISVGEPQDERVRQLCDASIAGINEGLAFIKPGVSARQVDEVTKAAPTRAGFGDCCVSRAGYGVGIGFPPDWGEGRTISLGGGDETILEPNMTFHYMNPIWVEGFTKVNFSETIRVTDDGCEVITNFPRELIIV